MIDLGLEVETLEKTLYVNSPLGTRVSVNQICRGLWARDLKDSTHYGPEGHGHVGV